ncbi:translation initiation factor IF-2 [Aminobacterium mobile]|uniref:translation initiation factor IF-2 n=1 Tax=Aminobacterium mobile TaxID=81467 RepID=UPI0004636BBA|nr:translation initiation factor IF-2 [Aminobacterium mobile]
MSKIRVYELAKMLGKSNKDLLSMLEDLGVEVKTHMSSIDTEVAQLIEETVKSEEGKHTPQMQKEETMVKEKQCVRVRKTATVKEVARLIDVPVAETVKTLVDAEIMAPAGTSIDEAILLALGEAYNIEFQFEEEGSAPKEEGKTLSAGRPVFHGDHMEPRSPIVTVMGHVDHGKTTLLDYIRKTNISAREAGGITQHIGASTVDHEGKKIIFLDTPGHEAFTAMRARGAQATDVAILVVAADDGLMPQTREAINHAKAAGVPIVVAVNKIDKPAARPDRVRQQLSDIGLVPEEWGGDTIMVDVSAKTGQGIPQLLEMVLLVAEMEELKADPTVTPEGIVIEAKLDKGKGPVATVIVQQGTLHRGDIILLDSTWGKIRAMLDSRGRQVSKAGPSTPVEVLGLTSVPQPGERFILVENEREARDKTAKWEQIKREAETVTSKRMTLEELYSQMKEGEIPQLNLLVKCDVQGTCEALCAALEKMGTSEVGINIIHRGVGRIAESDIMLASASNAVIIGFNVRPDKNAQKIAEVEGIQIRLYDVIYDVIDDVKVALEGMLTPTIREEPLGQAEIRQVFKVPKAGKIAGCYVTEGTIKRSARARVIRDGVVVWTGSLSNLKRFKDEAREVNAGYECGINFAGFQDFREGDVIEAFELIEERRHLD